MPNYKGYICKHSILDLFGCENDTLASVRLGLRLLRDVCRSAGITITGTLSKAHSQDGYSCWVFLGNSHFSIHTWPDESYCAADIFLSSGSIENIEEELIKRLRPGSYRKEVLERGVKDSPNLGYWIHSNRTQDYFEAFRATGPLIKKKSAFQTIEIFDNPSFGRILMLDGDIQLSTSDEAIYHEFLVHPAILAHSNPHKILLIGGGDGGALREIVKHVSLDRIVQVEIDRDVIRQCSESLKEVNQGAFKDPRLEIVFEDAGKFLGKEKFDIIISDLTAPKGPSLTVYNKMLTELVKSMNRECFVSMHSGWWSSKKYIDYPSMIFRRFPHLMLYNQWVDSFACFWSFIIGWRHKDTLELVLTRIKGSNGLKGTKHFRATQFLQHLFVRPQKDSESKP